MAKAETEPEESRADFEAALALWDENGLRDKVVGIQERYATYKLALLVLAAEAVKAEESFRQRDAVVEWLLRMQNEVGGWITDYMENGKPLGKANVETTALAILALRGR